MTTEDANKIIHERIFGGGGVAGDYAYFYPLGALLIRSRMLELGYWWRMSCVADGIVRMEFIEPGGENHKFDHRVEEYAVAQAALATLGITERIE